MQTNLGNQTPQANAVTANLQKATTKFKILADSAYVAQEALEEWSDQLNSLTWGEFEWLRIKRLIALGFSFTPWPQSDSDVMRLEVRTPQGVTYSVDAPQQNNLYAFLVGLHFDYLWSQVRPTFAYFREPPNLPQEFSFMDAFKE